MQKNETTSPALAERIRTAIVQGNTAALELNMPERRTLHMLLQIQALKDQGITSAELLEYVRLNVMRTSDRGDAQAQHLLCQSDQLFQGLNSDHMRSFALFLLDDVERMLSDKPGLQGVYILQDVVLQMLEEARPVVPAQGEGTHGAGPGKPTAV